MIAPLTNIGFLSYVVAFLGFFILCALVIISSRGSLLGRRLILASTLTACWALASALMALSVPLPNLLVIALELGRSLGWCVFLLGTIEIKHSVDDDQPADIEKLLPNWMWLALTGVLLLNILILPFASTILPGLERFAEAFREAQLISWVAVAIVGLLLTEQVIRNLSVDQKWVLKYLCLGVGAIFAYDFFLYSNALLFKSLDPELWMARGFINAVAVPLIAVSVARNTKLDVGIHVSREAVFHSVTLIGAGAYLMAMAAVGYYIRLYGGNWGHLLQIVFLVAAGIFLGVLLFSDSIRRRLRVLLSKHFYSFKYDYRGEWLRFTGNLAASSETVLDRICHALAEIVHSPGAYLWCKNTHDNYELINCWAWAEPVDPELRANAEIESLQEFMERTLWVIDIHEYQAAPEKYQELNLPAWMLRLSNAWLIVPLSVEQQVVGFVVIRDSNHMSELNWEDHDLLKMAGQQAAILLMQYRSEQALIEARQFEAFNRLSAYTMHDLKNILAQQSLIVSNAEKHKGNPAFIEDVLSTVANSVERMTRLLEQMKRGERNQRTANVDINTILQSWLNGHNRRKPNPQLQQCDDSFRVRADKERLTTVFGHLIQNAQEATPESGDIWIRTRVQGQSGVVEIEDNGTGMDPAFIRDRLWKPFDSTKGLTGMGIGAFESRNYIQSLGGTIQVESTPGKGSLFRITLPL